jgi:hypothetical protein
LSRNRATVVGGAFDEVAGFEAGADADEGDEVGCVDRAPAGLGGFDELERHGQTGGLGARSFGDLGAVADVAKVDSMVIWSPRGVVL